MDTIDTRTIEHNGRAFRVAIVADPDHGTPWGNEDGHGPVSNWTARDKRPGERVLSEDHGSRRYYDFAEAVRIARADGWDAPPFGGTPGERAARAAEADFQRLRAWCNDEWFYVGVVVSAICPECGEPIEATERSLWGIESDAGDYLDQVAHELADEVTDAKEGHRDA